MKVLSDLFTREDWSRLANNLAITQEKYTKWWGNGLDSPLFRDFEASKAQLIADLPEIPPVKQIGATTEFDFIRYHIHSINVFSSVLVVAFKPKDIDTSYWTAAVSAVILA